MNEAKSLSQALTDLQSFCTGLLFLSEIPKRAKDRAKKKARHESVIRWKARHPFSPELQRQHWHSCHHHPATLAYKRDTGKHTEYLLTFDKVTWRWYPDATQHEYQVFPDLGKALYGTLKEICTTPA